MGTLRYKWREGFTSFNENKRTRFCGEKLYNEAFQARKLKIKRRPRPLILDGPIGLLMSGICQACVINSSMIFRKGLICWTNSVKP